MGKEMATELQNQVNQEWISFNGTECSKSITASYVTNRPQNNKRYTHHRAMTSHKKKKLGGGW